MQRLQLYIEDNEGNYPLVDLFDDETVSLTSTIKDVKDIGKVFTDYSQTFTVPASDTNNKIFRHYYNYYITGNAFDSRKKKQALLHLNYAPFRRGRIYLNSVKMRDNKAYAYELIFYGNTVSLKNLIGDDELTSLSQLQNYNHNFTEANVRNGLTGDLNINGQANSIIYPLITSKKRLYVDSGSPSFDENFSGNIYHDINSPADTIRGLEYVDLKPAIKVIHIIEAIESKYNINFTRSVNTGLPNERNTFFNSVAFSNLYLWRNSKNGNLNDIEDGEDFLFNNLISDYAYVSGSNNLVTITGANIVTDLEQTGSYLFELRLTTSNQDVPYDIKFKNITSGNEKKQSGLGDKNFDFSSETATEPQTFNVEVVSESEFDYDLELLVEYNSPQASLGAIYETTTTQTTSFELNLIGERSSLIPKIKVIDFLTGIFKMFNLTAYYIDDLNDVNFGKVYIDTLDNFYGDAVVNPIGATIDITKYIDAQQHTVDSVLPFTDINFKYSSNDTLLMENHKLQFNEVFGDSEYNVREETKDPITGEYKIDRGTKYDIDVPFSHMKYERLIDINVSSQTATNQTLIQYGYCASGEFDATDGVSPTVSRKGDYNTTTIPPLLFYAILEENLPAGVVGDLEYTSKRINYISTPTPTGLSSYWRPSNSQDTGSTNTPPTYSLNFDQEFDEWQAVNYGSDSNSLFKVYYKNYIESVFNPAKRIFKMTAYLPTNIIINYRLNDQIKIHDKMFRINSITTNLNTGKSELELLNIFTDEIVE